MFKADNLKSPESGLTLLYVVVSLFFIMIFTSYGLNLIYNLSDKSRLEAVAKEVAMVAGGYLPDVKMAAEKGIEYFKIARLDLTRGSDAINNSMGLKLELYVTSAKGNRVKLTTNPIDDSFVFDETKVELPIESITASISRSRSLLFFDFTNSSFSKLVQMNAEATVHLMPTDVVLIIENSNSLITPLIGESSSLLAQNIIRKPNSKTDKLQWDLSKVGIDQSSGDKGIYRSSKSMLYARQCFGEAAYNLKKSAILLYDLLSSSSTFRVAVIHPTTGSGELAHLAVPITMHPTERSNFTGRITNATSRVNSNYRTPDFGISIDPNMRFDDAGTSNIAYLDQSFGMVDQYSTRCAAMTGAGFFPIPPHPFAGGRIFTTAGAYYSSKFLSDFVASSSVPQSPFMTSKGTTDNTNLLYSHLRFKAGPVPSGNRFATDNVTPSLRILPREAIWIKNSGYIDQIGIRNPKYDYTNLYASILKAIDVLNNAPIRNDHIIVKRKVILMMIDGIDDVLTLENRQVYEHGTPSLTLTSGTTILGNDPKMKEVHRFCENPSSLSFPDSTDEYNIYSQTKTAGIAVPDDIFKGFKLGLLVYGFTGSFYSPAYGAAEYNGYQNSIKFHLPFNDTTVNWGNVRTNCSNSWSMNRGRFFAEASPDKSIYPNLSVPVGYNYDLVPKVARSLFVPEIVR